MMVRITIVLLSAAMLSCSTSPPVTAASDVTATQTATADPSGNYVLKTIDGNALPFRPMDRDRPASAGPGPLVVGGSLAIEAGGQVHYVLNYRGPQGRENAIRMNATLLREGDRSVLVWPNGARTPTTYDGQRFTIDNIGMKLMFERER